MKLAIILFYRAKHGGLQENVRATALHVNNRGGKVVVLAPPGPFLSSLETQGVEVFPVEYGDESSERRAVTRLNWADVIHAHPGPGRCLALEAAQASGAPVFFTIHGAWFDSIHLFAHRLEKVVCVSEAIADAVAHRIPGSSDKIVCVQNGVDTDVLSPFVEGDERQYVAVASRFDADKRRLVDLLVRLWDEQANMGDASIRWRVAGDGTLLDELIGAAKRLGERVQENPVEFMGWLKPDVLPDLYGRAAVAVAPGRSAAEALAAGTPVIAIGSGGMAPVFSMDELGIAACANFGGFGTQELDLPAAELIQIIKRGMLGRDLEFSRNASLFVAERLSNNKVNQMLFDMYVHAQRAVERQRGLA